jgi:hypothetical protein
MAPVTEHCPSLTPNPSVLAALRFAKRWWPLVSTSFLSSCFWDYLHCHFILLLIFYCHALILHFVRHIFFLVVNHFALCVSWYA